MYDVKMKAALRIFGFTLNCFWFIVFVGCVHFLSPVEFVLLMLHALVQSVCM